VAREWDVEDDDSGEAAVVGTWWLSRCVGRIGVGSERQRIVEVGDGGLAIYVGLWLAHAALAFYALRHLNQAILADLLALLILAQPFGRLLALPRFGPHKPKGLPAHSRGKSDRLLALPPA